MSSAPIEPNPGTGQEERVPAGDLGVGGPADDPGDGQGAGTPPGYPEQVDPAEGPLAGRSTRAPGGPEGAGGGRPV